MLPEPRARSDEEYLPGVSDRGDREEEDEDKEIGGKHFYVDVQEREDPVVAHKKVDPLFPLLYWTQGKLI